MAKRFLSALTTQASTTASAGLQLPHGDAPSAPADGDVWTTTAGLYVRVNGSTVGPLSAGGGTPASTVTTLSGLQSAVVGTSSNYAREDHQHAVTNLVDMASNQSTIGGVKTFTAVNLNHWSTSDATTTVRSTNGSATLSVEGDNNAANLYVTAAAGSAYPSLALRRRNAAGFAGSSNIINSDFLGVLSFRGYESGTELTGALIAGISEGDWNTGSTPTRLEIRVAPSGSATPVTELTINATSSTFANKVITPATATSSAGLNLPHGTAPSAPTNGDMWTTTAGAYVRINGATVGPLASSANTVNLTGDQTVAGIKTFSSQIIAPAATTSIPSIRLPHGSAPSAPTNGDVWTTTVAPFVRINGVTKSMIEKVIPFAKSGTLTTGTGASRFYVEEACTIKRVRASVNTAPTGASVIVDINKNGTTIFTTQGNRPTIAISGFTSGAVSNMDVTSLDAGDYLTVDVDQIGSTIAGADLVVTIWVEG